MYQTKIGHAHLKVRDLNRAVGFYEAFLGLEPTERLGDRYAFLASPGGGMRHEIALQNVGPEAPGQHRFATGLHHVAFEVPDRRSLAEAYFRLTDAGVPVAPVNHLVSWAIYFSDPDGNGLEVYWDAREAPEGGKLWRGHNLPIPEADLRATLLTEPAAVEQQGSRTAGARRSARDRPKAGSGSEVASRPSGAAPPCTHPTPR